MKKGPLKKHVVIHGPCVLCGRKVGPGAYCAPCRAVVCWRHHNPERPSHTLADHATSLRLTRIVHAVGV